MLSKPHKTKSPSCEGFFFLGHLFSPAQKEKNRRLPVGLFCFNYFNSAKYLMVRTIWLV